MTFCNSPKPKDSTGLQNIRRARAILENVAGAHGASYDSSKVTNIFAGTTFNPASTAPTVSPDFVVDANRTLAGQMSSIGLRMEMLRSRSERQKKSGDLTEERLVLVELSTVTRQAADEMKDMEGFRRFVSEVRETCDQLLSATVGAK